MIKLLELLFRTERRGDETHSESTPPDPADKAKEYRFRNTERDLLERNLEGVVGVAVLLIQRPADCLAQVLQGYVVGLRDVRQHAVHRLRLVVPLLALDHVFGVDSPLGQINIT